MLIIFLLTMSFHFLPRMLHEVFGLSFLAAMIVHLAWNRRWLSSLRSGKWPPRRILLAAVAILLMFCAVATIVTGIFISNYLFKDAIGINLHRSILIHQLHVSLPYLMLILTGLHLGLHIKSIAARLQAAQKFRFCRAHGRIICLPATTILITVGVYGSFLNRIGDRLMMKHIFATDAINEPWAVFLLLLVGIVALYAFIGFLLSLTKK